MRLFIAIDFSEEVRSYVSKVQEQMNGFGRFSFPKPENMHLTLKFLGDYDTNNAISKLKSVEFAPFELSLSKLGKFGNDTRVIWLGFKECPELLKLKNSVDWALQDQDDFPYEPHLTIARVKHLDNLSGLDKLLHQQISSLIIPVTSYALFNSELVYQGPKYQEIARFPRALSRISLRSMSLPAKCWRYFA